MTINASFMARPNKTSSLTVDSDIDFTGYDITADNFNGHQVDVDTIMGVTLYADHFKERTGAHNMVADNTATGFGVAPITISVTGGTDGDQPLDTTRDRQAHKITLYASQWVMFASMKVKKDTGAPTGTLVCRVRRADTDAVIQQSATTYDIASCTSSFVEKFFALPLPSTLYAGDVYVSFEVTAGTGAWNSNYCVVPTATGTTLPLWYKEGAGAWTANAATQMDGSVVVAAV